MKIHFYLFPLLLLLPGYLSAQPAVNLKEPLPYILDMVHDNPGEPATVTKYTNPLYLKECGFTGMVPQWYVQCGITYDSFEPFIVPENSTQRRWIQDKQAFVNQRLTEACKAGLPVYTFTDMFVIPTLIMDKYRDKIMGENNKPDINKPLTQQLIRIQVREIFETFPQLGGLVIRFGETYLQNTPYHSGNNPMKEDVNDHITLLYILREEVCVKLNKKIFYRTWDFGWLHTNKERYIKVTDGVEPHENLIFSIKYSNGDFHRNTWFNQTLGYGKHPYIVEFQGQPEYTGKGAYPVYMFGGMLRDYEENPTTYPYKGMNDLKDDPRFVGIWTWSRGGGWRGPYIKNELFCDINTRAAAIWAGNRSLSEEQVLEKTLRALGIKNRSVKDFIHLLHLAETAVLKGRYSKLPGAAMNVWWTRDQFISDAGMLNETLERAVRKQQGLSADLLIEEKEESVALWKEIEKLSRTIRMNNPVDEKYLAVSATYGRILYEIYAECIKIFLYLKKYEMAQELNIDIEAEKHYTVAAINHYDDLWKEFDQLYEDNPDLCATLYEPFGFSQSGRTVKGSYENGAAKSVDEARRLLDLN